MEEKREVYDCGDHISIKAGMNLSMYAGHAVHLQQHGAQHLFQTPKARFDAQHLAVVLLYLLSEPSNLLLQ